LKVRVLAADSRAAYLMPHWENWQWKADNASRKFGELTVQLNGGGSPLAGSDRKTLLACGVHMSPAGLVPADAKSGGQIVLTINGLSPGKHTIATYHTETRDKVSSDYEIAVNGKAVVAKFTPSRNATND